MDKDELDEELRKEDAQGLNALNALGDREQDTDEWNVIEDKDPKTGNAPKEDLLGHEALAQEGNIPTPLTPDEKHASELVSILRDLQPAVLQKHISNYDYEILADIISYIEKVPAADSKLDQKILSAIYDKVLTDPESPAELFDKSLKYLVMKLKDSDLQINKEAYALLLKCHNRITDSQLVSAFIGILENYIKLREEPLAVIKITKIGKPQVMATTKGEKRVSSIIKDGLKLTLSENALTVATHLYITFAKQTIISGPEFFKDAEPLKFLSGLLELKNAGIITVDFQKPVVKRIPDPGDIQKIQELQEKIKSIIVTRKANIKTNGLSGDVLAVAKFINSKKPIDGIALLKKFKDPHKIRDALAELQQKGMIAITKKGEQQVKKPEAPIAVNPLTKDDELTELLKKEDKKFPLPSWLKIKNPFPLKKRQPLNKIPK